MTSRKKAWTGEYLPTPHTNGVHVDPTTGVVSFPVKIEGQGDRPVRISIDPHYMDRIVRKLEAWRRGREQEEAQQAALRVAVEAAQRRSGTS
jgi:predicted glycoside hydrolase/deacetylase ChbG (UPF0249 family)